jgi:hypothetical protein
LALIGSAPWPSGSPINSVFSSSQGSADKELTELAEQTFNQEAIESAKR